MGKGMSRTYWTKDDHWSKWLAYVLIADREVEYRNDCMIDIEMNLGMYIGDELVDKVLTWSPKWHEYYPDTAEWIVAEGMSK